MIVRTPSLAERLRKNIQQLGPDAVQRELAAIAAEDRDKAEAVAAEAKRTAAAEEKVAAALEERTAAVAADWYAVQQESVRQAAERLARQQLRLEHGLDDPRTVAMSGGWPTRLTQRRIDAILGQVVDSLPLPWVKGRPSSAGYRSAKGSEQAAAEAPRDRKSVV